jgi:hypothetical protein
MRLATICLAIAIASVVVSGVGDPEESCRRYDFDVRFFPAFHLPAAVKLTGRTGSAELTITYGNSRTHGHRKERLLLPGEISQAFCSRLAQLAALAASTDNRSIIDGITVEGAFQREGAPPFAFIGRSPSERTQPAEYAIADAVFALFEAGPVSCELNEALEELALYFDFAAPVRIMSEPAATLRIYGFIGEEHDALLTRLVGTLPTDKPLQIDFTNYPAVHTTPPPRLQRLIMDLAANRRVKWLAGSEFAGTLRRFGVDKTRIETVEGPNCPLQRTRFARR